MAVREGTGGAKPLTDQDRRDIEANARRTLGVDRHPTATFESQRIVANADGGTIRGTLTLHSTAAPIEVRVTEVAPTEGVRLCHSERRRLVSGGMRTFVRSLLGGLGLVTVVAGGWALARPDSFSEFVNFPPQPHFVHDVGAFQLGLGAALLLALIWADAATVALAGYLIGGVAHTASHLADAHLGGSPTQTIVIGLFAVLAAAALMMRWQELGRVMGDVGRAATALAPFSRQKTVLLTTYRRDGTPVGTPVSIAVDGERAYVRSFERAWKTRRIRRNPVVAVAPSTVRGTPTGPAITATARRLSGDEQKAAARALARKYPLLHGVLVPLTHRLGRAKTGRTVHFELVLPTADADQSALRDQSVAKA